MSLDYWVIRGVGVNADDVRFNNEKVKHVLREQFAYETELLDALNDDNFDIGEFVYECGLDSIADFLTFCDDTDTLTYGEANGRSFFYYPPSMPWELTPNDPTSREEVYKNIIAAIQKVSDMTEEEIRTMIYDDLNEVGYG